MKRYLKFVLLLANNDRFVGSLKMYGKKIPKKLKDNLCQAVTDAQWYQQGGLPTEEE